MNYINREIEYFENEISKITYNPERFKLYIGEDKYLMGVRSTKNEEVHFGKFMQYNTLYNTLQDLDLKIKISFSKAIEYAYCQSVRESYSPLHKNSEEEILAYYYIENALFRTSSLWDMLAQLYRLFYEIDIKIDKVYYKKIFDPSSSHSIKFKEKAKNIKEYIDQEDNKEMEGEWEGNHNYINDIRNKMTHRNSPSVTSISDFDLNLKDGPSFMLKRIIEDYSTVSNYIMEILYEIEIDIKKDFISI